jgi:hypothetical protein
LRQKSLLKWLLPRALDPRLECLQTFAKLRHTGRKARCLV